MTYKEIFEALHVIQGALSEDGIDSQVNTSHGKDCKSLELCVFYYENGVKYRDMEIFSFMFWPENYFVGTMYDVYDVVKNERLIHELMNRFVYKSLMVVA